MTTKRVPVDMMTALWEMREKAHASEGVSENPRQLAMMLVAMPPHSNPHHMKTGAMDLSGAVARRISIRTRQGRYRKSGGIRHPATAAPGVYRMGNCPPWADNISTDL